MVCELSIEGFDGWDPDIEAFALMTVRDAIVTTELVSGCTCSRQSRRAPSVQAETGTNKQGTTELLGNVSSGLICQETRAAGSEPRTKPSETQTLQGNTSNESLLTSSTSEALLFRYDSVIMLPAATCTNVQSRLNTKVKLDLVCSVIGSTA